MSTRSRIAMLELDGKVFETYCHWNGGLTSNGETLRKHYWDVEKIKALISGGMMSSLRSEIGEKHDFDEYKKVEPGQLTVAEKNDWTTYYGRDRGETEVEPILHADLEEFLRSLDDTDCEYAYLFKVEEDKWYWTKIYENLKSEHFKVLTTKDCQKNGVKV